MPNIEGLIAIIQKSQKTLFILCGLPYAGKSFIAEEIQKNTDATYVSIDAIFYERGFDWNTNRLPSAEEWQDIFNDSYDRTKEALKQGKNVLYDSTNHTVVSRVRLREVAASVYADTHVIYIQSSIETIWRRWKENSKDPKRPVISEDLVQSTINTFEEPAREENVLVVHN